MGSKNRISKYIVPIIQKYIDDSGYEKYYEPFCGGANVIDKISCKQRYGSDIHKYLIALLKKAADGTSDFPLHISEEEYKLVRDNKDDYEDWYVGLVGFCATFSGKWFNGYARGFKDDGVTLRDVPNETIRNIIKQAPNLKDIQFSCCDFRAITDIKESVIYCDIPYKNTTKYAVAAFPYNEFYDWCRAMSKNNIVIVSEYSMPEDFECIWQKTVKTSVDSNKKANDEKNNRVEKLFICKSK
jgi:site-specific DNA-adenine methylase